MLMSSLVEIQKAFLTIEIVHKVERKDCNNQKHVISKAQQQNWAQVIQKLPVQFHEHSRDCVLSASP
jgi:hypothetical protein